MKKLFLLSFLFSSLITMAQYKPATWGTFKPGIKVAVHYGMYNKMPDITKIGFQLNDTVSDFNLQNITNKAFPSKDSAENFVAIFNGYINVMKDDDYHFYSYSDDGSKILIDGVLVVDNDSIHSITEKYGTIALKAGNHEIEVQYFQKLGALGLNISYSSLTLLKQEVPADKLFTLVTTESYLPLNVLIPHHIWCSDISIVDGKYVSTLPMIKIQGYIKYVFSQDPLNPHLITYEWYNEVKKLLDKKYYVFPWSIPKGLTKL